MKKTMIYAIASVALFCVTRGLKKQIDKEVESEELDPELQDGDLEILEEEIIEEIAD